VGKIRLSWICYSAWFYLFWICVNFIPCHDEVRRLPEAAQEPPYITWVRLPSSSKPAPSRKALLELFNKNCLLFCPETECRRGFSSFWMLEPQRSACAEGSPWLCAGFPHAGAAGTSSVGERVLCQAPPGSVGAIALAYPGITRSAREVGAAQVGREIGLKTSEETRSVPSEGLSCEMFSLKCSWPWLLVRARAHSPDSFRPESSAFWFSIRHMRAGSF